MPRPQGQQLLAGVSFHHHLPTKRAKKTQLPLGLGTRTPDLASRAQCCALGPQRALYCPEDPHTWAPLTLALPRPLPVSITSMFS